MSVSFDLDPVERLTAGAVGEPGSRTFFVQAHGAGAQVTLGAEKEQVRLLADAAHTLLAQLPDVDDEGLAPDEVDLGLIEPLLPEWHVGEMSLEYDDSRDRISILISELVADEAEEATEPGTARFVATRAQLRAMAEHASEVVAAGRPRCQLCGYPMPPGGEHPCPARNGHGRPPL